MSNNQTEAQSCPVSETASDERSAQELLHKLQAHQLELEMQNEALRRSHGILEESRNRYRDLYDYSPVGYLRLTHAGLISEINLTAAELLGVERGQLLHRHFASLITPKDRDRWSLFSGEIVNNNQRLSIELSLSGYNDTKLSVRLDCQYINSMLHITLIDLTEEIKDAASALQEAEKKNRESAGYLRTAKIQEASLSHLQKITSLVPGMVYKFRLRPDGSAHFPFASEGIRELFRLSPGDVRDDASQLFALIHPDDFDGVVTSIQKAVQNLAPWSHEYRVKFADGSVRWVFGSSLPEQEEDGSNHWYWYGFMSDITERKQIEAKREEAHNSLQKIASQVPGVVYQFHLRTDGSSCFPFASEALRDIYRITPEEVREDAAKVFAILHPDDYDYLNASIQKSAQDLSQWHCEYRVKFDDGTVRWLLGDSLPQREADGSTLWHGFITDITERKQAEEKLRLSYLALKQINQGLAIISHDQNILWVNDAFSSITGYSRAEILGQHCRFMNGPLTDPKVISNIRLAVKNGTPFAGEILNYRKDGTMFWNELTSSPVFDEQGQLTNFISTTRDITERKQIDNALRESEFLWKCAIEGAGDGVWDWNLLTNEMHYSKCWKEMLGYTQNEILPSHQEWLDRIHPDDQLPVAKVMQAYLDGKTAIYVVEFRLRCKDDSYKWILGRGLLVDYDEEGTPLRMIGTHTDISKRKHQEQQDKAHLDQLAHVTRLGVMGEMASGIAHEVNQPLTAIATYTQASLNLMKAECPNLEKLAEIVYKTQQQALRAGQIIRRMREFVKSNTKQVSAADLNELIQDAVNLCLPELKLANITLSLELQGSLPFVNVDTLQIEQVIINLIRNSADAFDGCPDNQQREISIHSLLTLNQGIEVRVKDNGPGIAEDQQQKILMPFYTTKTEGMGMGLSICCSIIEAHEGHLHFNSKAGKGTTFYFNLPIKEINGIAGRQAGRQAAI
ncbi:MAG: PAS domain-containing protein [Methylococcaceae bacterium]